MIINFLIIIQGTYANYYVTNNFFYLIIIIAIVYLLKKHLKSTDVLLISLLFFVQSYNRVVFILPIMLLLSLPSLIEKKNCWLRVWFLTSLFHGLYYPLCGVATCLAFFPMAIWQIVTYARSGELKKDVRTIRFWLGWLACFVLTLLCMNFLLGTLKHMLAMSNQSILADGISRFGQLVPAWFFSNFGVENNFIRLALYYIVTFVIPSAFVWVAYALSLKTGKLAIENKRIRVKNKRNFCILISTVIMPLVCYSYTVIRLDVDSIYARSTDVLFIGMVLLFVWGWNYIENGKLRLVIVAFAAAIPAVVGTLGIFCTDWNSKLQSCYTVPENYVYVDSDPVKKMGKGFVNQDIYNTICDVNNRFAIKDKKQSYYGDPTQFGYFYLLDIKGSGVIELATTVKSFSATQESVDVMRETQSIVGSDFNSYYNYYMYHWLLMSGEYYWDAATREFYPNNGKYTKAEILEQNKNNDMVTYNIGLGKTAGAWGLSMSTLENLFTEKKVNYDIAKDGLGTDIRFREKLNGEDADFIYLEFDNDASVNYNYTLYDLYGEVKQDIHLLDKYLMKKNYNPGMTVQVWWQDENGEVHVETCNMLQGKLLLPLGAGAKWLLNEHYLISVHVFQDDVEIATPEITDIKFLKIREVQ